MAGFRSPMPPRPPMGERLETVEQARQRIEGKLAADLDAHEHLRLAFRAAELLDIDVLGHLHEAQTRISFAQSVLAERSSE